MSSVNWTGQALQVLGVWFDERITNWNWEQTNALMAMYRLTDYSRQRQIMGVLFMNQQQEQPWENQLEYLRLATDVFKKQ